MSEFDIENPGNVFDIRDVIERFKELESDWESVEMEIAEAQSEGEDAKASDILDDWESGDGPEFRKLNEFLESVKGYGGDEQFRGDWYPLTFIADHYFTEYARDFAEDIGAVDSNASWPNGCIDWDQAARELQVDYSCVEVDGTTYWYR